VLRQIGSFISLHDVANAQGFVLTNEQAWAAGKLLQRLHRWEYGADPVKDNRVKKAGSGTHCFALYPDTQVWRDRMDRAIRTVRAQASAQLSLPLAAC
jgi:hypothetical protein